MTPKTLTCVLVDDEQSNLDVLANYVNQIPFLVLKATFTKPLEALAYLIKTPSDLLITDISMPRLSGIELYESMCPHVNTKVIFISGYPEKIMEAIQHTDKVIDYLPKPLSLKRFEYSIEKLFKNQDSYNQFSSIINQDILNGIVEKYITLSPAQKRVFEQIAKGKSTKEIADILFIADGTVSLHRSNIREKLSIPASLSLKEIANFIINDMTILR
jgi:FixJ family two-component response regulator